MDLIKKMPSFYFNIKDSYLDYGIVINQLPPDVIPESDIEEIEIIGRDGNLTVDHNAKKSYTLPLVCTLMDFTRINEVKAWLQGSGDLIFNWQDYKYEARLINKIDIAQSLDQLGEFPLIWKVQPYKKSIDNPIITLTIPGTIFNPGTAISLPTIKVYGTGSITLNINSNIINLTNVSGYMTINSELMDAYKDTLLKNNDMAGEFPLFQVGNNTISWSGTFSKLEIIPNWRWI